MTKTNQSQNSDMHRNKRLSCLEMFSSYRKTFNPLNTVPSVLVIGLFLALFLLLALSPLPRLQSYPTHLCVLNRICGDCWHKVTPTGCERHSDIAFFLSSQPLPQSLHPHQIFFYSSLRGKRGGRLRRELTHTECRHSLLYPVLIPNFTHSCTCAHTAPAVFFFIHRRANHSSPFSGST